MRLIQLSDIHLSKANLQTLENFYREALLTDLQKISEETPIDLIIITGDLVDKGGQSFIAEKEEAYASFEISFLIPLRDHLKLKNERILFIPGNHDVTRDGIQTENEFYLTHNLNTEKANTEIQKNKIDFTPSNLRLKLFKEFEKKFHYEDPHYQFSNNESCAIIDTGEGKVGIALLNDSWRTGEIKDPQHHFVGINQLYNAIKFFNKENTIINIAVFHHVSVPKVRQY